ncbi:hypothetical protein GCM10007978_30460 [Shewanella hanedai]|nr:hypothetical protein GCM10007978_30460 [Shewanella hanedai]
MPAYLFKSQKKSLSVSSHYHLVSDFRDKYRSRLPRSPTGAIRTLELDWRQWLNDLKILVIRTIKPFIQAFSTAAFLKIKSTNKAITHRGESDDFMRINSPLKPKLD